MCKLCNYILIICSCVERQLSHAILIPSAVLNGSANYVTGTHTFDNHYLSDHLTDLSQLLAYHNTIALTGTIDLVLKLFEYLLQIHNYYTLI